MPSIFTRSRTTSTPAKNTKNTLTKRNGSLPAPPPKDAVAPDEFGRVNSRVSLSTPSKKDKKKDGGARQRTHSAPEDGPFDSLPDGSFLPFSLAPPESPDEPRLKLHSYGYLSYQSQVVLDIDQVTRLVEVISHELCDRGLTTPLLFSNLAIDISPSRIHRLIDAFLRTCPVYRPGSSSDLKWHEEAQFSSPHELAMTLRWGLARIVRISQGHETHGIIPWESYLRWREDEGAAGHPTDFFTTFLTSLQPPVQPLFTSLLSLLTRLTAHSTSSGLTPPTLASLFGPLLFGLGATTLPFHHTYGAYLRCSHATEHLLLAHIRTEPPLTLPSRLKDWIRGYPAMLPPMHALDRARQGARTVRVTSVRRNVRLYSPDLVRSAAAWAARGERGDLAGAREWTRVLGPQNAALPVRFSDQFRKRLDLAPHVLPDAGSAPGGHAHTSSGDSSRSGGADSGLGKEDEKRFGSLTELKWGAFESVGFGGGDEKRLEFDLNEGARRDARHEKRGTLTWSDFSTSGFSRTDAPLSATLQFSAPLESTISAWPTRQNELQHKLRKTAKALPPFGWDTSPVLGGEEAVEAGFLDVFCDLVYGSGWVDRRETTFRECNWALVEYKCMPQARPSGAPLADPRTAASLWLYEEFVPAEYRASLAHPKRKLPLPSFSSSKWKPAATLNGRPYVMGAVPRTPTTREMEFDAMLNAGAGKVTKVISLDTGGKGVGRVGSMASAVPPLTPAASDAPLTPPPPVPPVPSTPARRSRFLPGPGSMRKRPPAAEYDAVEFETRTMHAASEDDLTNPEARKSKEAGHGRKESKDDAWVDIMVRSQRRDGPASAGDPDVAREEVARALADAGPAPPEEEDVLPSENGHMTHENGTNEEPESVYGDGTQEEPVLDEPADEDVYGHPEEDAGFGRRRRRDAVVYDMLVSEDRDVRSSVDSEDFEPLRGVSLEQHEGADLAHARTESVVLPPNLAAMDTTAPAAQLRHTTASSVRARALAAQTNTAAVPPTPPKVPGGAGKGVSSLIEMYREREKEASAAPGPSKLPVRSSSLSSKKPAPDPVPEKVVNVVDIGEEDEDDMDENGAGGSAMRYVHGAPLHNVVEAPEEEDD